MLACLRTAALFGIDASPVHVEVDVSFGIPSFTMVGLPDASVRESRDRVKSAIRNSGFEFPRTHHRQPRAGRRPESRFRVRSADRARGSWHAGVVERREIADTVVLGELSLDGAIQPARVLPIAAAARRAGIANVLLPCANAGRQPSSRGCASCPWRRSPMRCGH
jgi:magnesium chelatase family protein